MSVQRDVDHWLSRANSQVEKLKQRIDALSNRFYMGCGFHYSFENEQRTVARQLSEIENGLREWDFVMVVSVRLEHLSEMVAEAEKSAVEWEQKAIV
jgi:hypothetical protein